MPSERRRRASIWARAADSSERSGGYISASWAAGTGRRAGVASGARLGPGDEDLAAGLGGGVRAPAEGAHPATPFRDGALAALLVAAAQHHRHDDDEPEDAEDGHRHEW